MKYLYLVGLNTNSFKLGNYRPFNLSTSFDLKRYVPTEEINEEDLNNQSINLLKYLPPNYNMKKHSSFIIKYSNNIEKIRVEWFKSIESGYKHVKELEFYDLLRIDKRTHTKMTKVYKDMEAHRNIYPELWI